MNSTILSTKKLSVSQKELLLNAKVGFVEYDAIKIDYLDFLINTGFDYYLFTSQNAVNSYLKNISAIKAVQKEVFCVGTKTKALLEANGFKVIEIESDANALGKIIVEKHQEKSFLYFTGNLRRDELPQELKKYNVQYKEVEVYQTSLIEKRFNRQFDIIMFFSPSGVKAFVAQNDLENSIAFCIGETTAKEAKKYTEKVIIANKPTIENVLVQVIKHSSYND
ncbi:uroporphyrinogen-III synthase [Croceitalea rosinachiae]|uniref:Uroporphyrinogen-III synthase n=1 Tax=Croceitalea rosinachiae TaxID=3075596 RepID=A0ABU3A7I4_9FLAO|nr:uroporphyrinogen-III synthase [Croceitalea sp. F388]MDT0606126.1 uroporphyrinogen-III synthase [Croceitalea sp. F388]